MTADNRDSHRPALVRHDMRIKEFLSLSSSAIGVIVTSACREVMSPEQAALRGTYALVSVNGSALPADVIGDGSGRILLLSETMRLDGRGNATDDVTERDSLSSAPAQVFLGGVLQRFVFLKMP